MSIGELKKSVVFELSINVFRIFFCIGIFFFCIIAVAGIILLHESCSTYSSKRIF